MRAKDRSVSPGKSSLRREAGFAAPRAGNLARLQTEVPGLVLAVETFPQGRRVLTPEEIVSLDLPLVVDVSHLQPERAVALIEAYGRGVRCTAACTRRCPQVGSATGCSISLMKKHGAG
jgi:hypothetical protein